MKTRTLLVIGLLGCGTCAAVLVFTADKRDWAEITLGSLNTTTDGVVTVNLTTRHSNGASIVGMASEDSVVHSRSATTDRWHLFPPKPGLHTMGFSLNPERKIITGSFTNSSLFSRLLLRVGDRRLIRTGEFLHLYDFDANGKHYTCVYKVISRDAP